MTLYTKFSLLLLVLLIGGCASQPAAENTASESAENTAQVAENTGSSSETSADSEPDPNELICRREQVTGSNFRRRVCLTRAQREERREEIQGQIGQSRSVGR